MIKELLRKIPGAQTLYINILYKHNKKIFEKYDTPQKLDNELRYSDEIKNIIFNKKTYVHNKKKIQQ